MGERLHGIAWRVRALIRARESSLIALAALVGLLGGLVVALMTLCVELLHQVFFQVPRGQRLSAELAINPLLAALIPVAGGLALGIFNEFLKRWRPEGEIDPIEANALHGGRMSFLGSVIVGAQTVWSTGVGASVGLEAGYTQFASGIASRIGAALRLRRSDLRVLVGCGAAAAIAGAFRAPLGGAFYAFELIIGSYSPASLAPVGVSALVGYSVTRTLVPGSLSIVAPERAHWAIGDLLLAGMIGLFSAAIGMVLMQGVAFLDGLFSRLALRPALRTSVGGLGVGLLALFSPQVMSTGEGALHILGMLDLSLGAVAVLFVAKIVASMVSLGSGFRGGLFFSSLLIGALGGHLLAAGLTAAWPTTYFDPNVAAVIGLSALSASVVGGPLTMTFIALETTGDLWLTSMVLVAVVISAQVTRELFGYSFATWRFHLRGETIRSAADVGWRRDLSVGRMMRPDVATTHPGMTIAAFIETFPLGSTTYVIVVDEADHYIGMLAVAEVHVRAVNLSSQRSVRDLVSLGDVILLPGMTAREALLIFDRVEAEALAVVESFVHRQVIGILTEAYVLRRYTGALESDRQQMLGEK
jgi:chloride channel protein, CIC family